MKEQDKQESIEEIKENMNKSEVDTTNLIGWYRFNTEEGNIFKDSSNSHKDVHKTEWFWVSSEVTSSKFLKFVKNPLIYTKAIYKI